MITTLDKESFWNRDEVVKNFYVGSLRAVLKIGV